MAQFYFSIPSSENALPISDDIFGRGMRIVGKLCDRVEFSKDENGEFCISAIKKIRTPPILVIK